MEEKGFDYINVIPLVDVMLVLLTIVLTTSAFIATGAIPLALPKASRSHTETLKTLTIEINKEGKVYLNAQLLPPQGLRAALQRLNRTMPVLIRADRHIGLQVFVDVLDAVKVMGFMTVSLQTEEKI